MLLFILTVNGFVPGGSDTAIRHNTQITHITQNNTAHKTTQAIKDTPYKMNTMQIKLRLQLYKLILINNKHTIH
jgi:hypothetical protein